jgi:pimeloyl-ACP methyl ester carboxylesterase
VGVGSGRPDAGIEWVECVAIELPGHGLDASPFGDLHTDAARVRHELDRLDGSVVLVGHSYGGAVITEAGDHPAVDHLVYLSGFPLELHESCGNAAGAESEAARISPSGRPDLADGFIQGADGWFTLDPRMAAQCLYNCCDADTVTWALRRLGPQPLVTLQQSPTAVAWRNKPTTYVVSADDLVVYPELQRILARRCGSVLEWRTDHSPFLSRPDLVADLLTELARQPA